MNIEEEIMIDADISDDPDKSVLMVYRAVGSVAKLDSVFTGKDAEKLYRILMKEESIS